MCAVTESTGTIDAACIELVSFSRHTERFLKLWLIVGRPEHPVPVLFLLLCQDFDVALGHAFFFRRCPTVMKVTVGESKRFLATYENFHVNSLKTTDSK